MLSPLLVDSHCKLKTYPIMQSTFSSSYLSYILSLSLIILSIEPSCSVFWSAFGSTGLGGQRGFGQEAVFFNLYSDCLSAGVNRLGICTASAYDCRSKGGLVVGNCYANVPEKAGPIRPPDQFGIGYSPVNQGRPVGVCCFCESSL